MKTTAIQITIVVENRPGRTAELEEEIRAAMRARDYEAEIRQGWGQVEVPGGTQEERAKARTELDQIWVEAIAKRKWEDDGFLRGMVAAKTRQIEGRLVTQVWEVEHDVYTTARRHDGGTVSRGILLDRNRE